MFGYESGDHRYKEMVVFEVESDRLKDKDEGHLVKVSVLIESYNHDVDHRITSVDWLGQDVSKLVGDDADVVGRATKALADWYKDQESTLTDPYLMKFSGDRS